MVITTEENFKMTEKKNHHFVPRFYLRYFSNHSDGKSIGVWNIQKALFIRHASLRDQACAEYFYGKDSSIEDSLGQMEGVAANVLNNMTLTQTLPSERSEERKMLLIYLVSQAERTQSAADLLNESIDKFIHTTYKDDKRVKDSLPNVRLGVENAALHVLSMIPRILPATTDLGMKLLVNLTDHEFLTSDHPVIKYNQFMRSRKWPGAHNGWIVMGLQLFFPISPRQYLVLYDKDLYRVGFRQKQVIEIGNVQDVDQLNALQLVNSNRNIYFNDLVKQEYVEELHRIYSNKRISDKMSVDEFHQINTEPKLRRSLIISHQNNIKMELKLSFISETKKAKRRQLGPSMSNPRNPHLLELLEDEWNMNLPGGTDSNTDNNLEMRI